MKNNKNISWILFFIVLSILSSLLIVKIVDIYSFLAIGSLFILGYFLYLIGPETVSEISLWKSSIKRDVTAAKEIRDEIEKIANDLRNVMRLAAENSYIIASSSFLAMGGNDKAKEKLESNLSELSSFVYPNEKEDKLWWEEFQNSIN